MTCMLVLSGRVELMVMHGGVKNNYEHIVVVSHLLASVSTNCRRY